MTTITIAKGDGIGPEIMDATLTILKAAGASLQYDEITIGEKVYLAGNKAGIADDAWQTIIKNKVFLKAPITTPQGGGYKSLNVSTRKFLGLYANIRPCKSLHPFVFTKHPTMDVVIIRENEEDLYAGIEHQQTDEVVQCLKLISRPGCEKIIRYAFEYAQQQGRKKVSCFTKDNIMKQTDGLFHQVFNEVAVEYPHIIKEHLIVDIGAAKLAATPEEFDVVVMPNLYGDILSDVAAQISGSVGMAGSANIGNTCAMFEAIHGSAPDIAMQNKANPSGLLQAAVMMLHHVGQYEVATTIQHAWLTTIEKGIHTVDIYKEGVSKQCVTTAAFAEAVIAHLHQTPTVLPAVSVHQPLPIQLPIYERKQAMKKQLEGVDLFVHWSGNDASMLASKIAAIISQTQQLVMITNRGIKVWPNGFSETFCTDHWRCRIQPVAGANMLMVDIISLLQKALVAGIDIIKTENLYSFDGKQAFSLGQGQ
ncbi:NADP-dependent isocitrate dehydrogenase [Ferruginibacter yonginensis]|uniref:Isocitrate dehydrogenase [NADP] n=1 Tax=Ferruginibacter yonginensis TaxID=1310416 RepID=A0ABV8QTZ1_9BACT